MRVSIYMLAILIAVQLAAAAAMGQDLLELYEYSPSSPPADKHPLLFKVPREFRYGSTQNTSRAFRILILTYYPSFTSPSDPRNKESGLNCAGICNGRILIAIAYQPRIAALPHPNMGDFIARSRIKYAKTPPYPPNVMVRELGPRGPFSEGFERITFSPGIQPPRVARTQTTFMRKSSDGNSYDLAATCEAGTRTTCTLHFSLNCNPAVYVSVVGLDASFLDQSSDIVEKANAFILPMMQTSSCNFSRSDLDWTASFGGR